MKSTAAAFFIGIGAGLLVVVAVFAVYWWAWW